jgi:hypothetical protein
MSMVRLLTAGKCLVGLKDHTARYRMANAKALPKFGSKESPFRSTTRAPLAEAQQTLLLAPDPEPAAAVVPRAPAAPISTPSAPALQTPTTISTPPDHPPKLEAGGGPGGATVSRLEKPGTRGRQVSRGLRHWIGWLQARLASLRGGTRLARVRRGAIRPVQGELSLDKVKVCCNDLSDSDVEVVAASPAPRKGRPRIDCEAVGVE